MNCDMECVMQSRNGDLTTFACVPLNVFAIMQQCIELVGVLLPMWKGYSGILRAEAKPWEPIPIAQNNNERNQ